MLLSLCVYVRNVEHGWFPVTVLSYKGTKANVSVAVPSSPFLGGGGEGILMEIYINTYMIPKRGSKLLVNEGGQLPIHNVDMDGNALEVANICALPRLHEVRYIMR